MRGLGPAEGRDQEHRLLECYRETREPKAFVALFGLYQKAVYTLLRRRTKDKDLASDLLGDVWIQSYKAIDTFEFDDRGGDRPFCAWLRKIAENVFNKWYRKASTSRELSVDPADSALSNIADDAPSPLQQLAHREEVIESLALLKSEELTRRELESLLLRFHEDLSAVEAAEVAGCSANAMRVRTHRAVEKLRQADRAKGNRP